MDAGTGFHAMHSIPQNAAHAALIKLLGLIVIYDRGMMDGKNKGYLLRPPAR
jgi:hypothetical protein